MGEGGEEREAGWPVSGKCLLLLMVRRRWVPLRADGGQRLEMGCLVVVQHTHSRTDVRYSSFTLSHSRFVLNTTMSSKEEANGKTC